MICKTDNMLNNHPKQQIDKGKEDKFFSSAKGLDYAPILTPDDVSAKLVETKMYAKAFDYGKKVVDNRKLVKIEDDDKIQPRLANLPAGGLSLSQSVIDDLLKQSNNIVVDSIGKFRMHLRLQGVIFKGAQDIKTDIKPYLGANLDVSNSDLYGQALNMARTMVGVKAPIPRDGR
jgi:hypothetical protein